MTVTGHTTWTRVLQILDPYSSLMTVRQKLNLANSVIAYVLATPGPETQAAARDTTAVYKTIPLFGSTIHMHLAEAIIELRRETIDDRRALGLIP